MTERIGQWVQRERGDRIIQRSKWHLVQSMIDDNPITKCGLRMKRELTRQRWSHDTRRYVPDGVDRLLYSTIPLTHFGFADYNSSTVCTRCR